MAKYTTTKTVTVIGDDGYRCRRGGHCLGHHGRLEASMVAGASSRVLKKAVLVGKSRMRSLTVEVVVDLSQ